MPVASESDFAKADPRWSVRPDWTSGRLVSSSIRNIGGLLLATVMCNVLGWVVAYKVLVAHSMGNRTPSDLLICIFPAGGLAMALLVVKNLRQWARYGQSVFEMDTTPAAIGGLLKGRIRAEHPLDHSMRVKLCLRCVDRTTGRDDSENLLWRHEEEAHVDPSDGSIPVSLLIPASAKPSAVIRPGWHINWVLGATGTGAGVTYEALFDPPVFAVDLPPEERAEAAAVAEQERKAAQQFQPLPGSGVRVRAARGEGTEFYFPPGRAVGPAIFWTIAGVAVTALTIYFATLGFSGFPFVPVFGFFAFILDYYVVPTLWFGFTLVEVNRTQIIATSTTLWRKKVSQATVANIQEIKTGVDMTAGNTTWYSIKIALKDATEFGAGGRLADMQEAEWLAEQMRKAAEL